MHHAELAESPEGHRLLMLSLEENGAMTAHSMPYDTLEWRVAEYGLDPTDARAALEWVLYERHLIPGAPSEHPLAASATIREAQRAQSARLTERRGTGRVRAADSVEARAAHERAVAAAKAEGHDPGLVRGAEHGRLKAAGATMRVIAESGDGDPIEFVLAHCPISVEHVAVKRAHAARVWGEHRRRVAERAAWVRESPEELRHRLGEGRTEHIPASIRKDNVQ